MRNLLVWLIIASAAVVISSCDRFEHAFQPPPEVDFAMELFTPLQNGFDECTATNLAPAMAYYADDYLQFGVNKADWETALTGMLAGVASPDFEVSFTSTSLLDNTNALANWRLRIINPDTRAVIADSNFVGERLVKRNGKWLLKGNQMTCEPPVGHQRIVVEYVTNINCSYCPPVENKLHELQMLYPNQFIYLTHQLSGPVAINDPLYAYYSAYSAPTSIIQGQYKLVSGTPDIVDSYSPLVESMLPYPTPMDYNFISTVVAGNTISGSVKLTPRTSEIDLSNLKLNLAIIDKVSTALNNVGEPLTNVVLARKRIDISAWDWNNPVAFEFSANVNIPDDAALIVFAQHTPATFANNANIYSGLQVDLTR